MKAKNYNLGALFLLGVISGVVSFFLVRATYWGVIVIPGLVFGAFVGIPFFKRLGLEYFWFIIASTLSYSWAILSVLAISYGWTFISHPTESVIFNTYISSPLVVYAGGLLGTLFFLFAFRQFIASPPRDAFLLLLLIGGALSMSFFGGYLADYTFPSQSLDLPVNQLLSLFIIWDSGMAVALGWAISPFAARKKLFIPVIIMIFVMIVALLLSESVIDSKIKNRDITPFVTSSN